MQFLLVPIYIVHVLVSLFLILVVLLQQGKGADLAVFGGGSTQAAFGARGAATLLHKLTVIGFVVFIATTMSIAILQTSGSGDSSVLSGAESAAMAPAEDSASGDEPAADASATGNEPATDEPAAEADSAAPEAGSTDAPAGSEGDDSTGDDG